MRGQWWGEAKEARLVVGERATQARSVGEKAKGQKRRPES